MSSAPDSPAIVRNVRLSTSASSEAVDISIEKGVISAVTPARADATDGYDGRGLLALPGLVNAHAHIDKSWWGLPWQSYGGEGTT